VSRASETSRVRTTDPIPALKEQLAREVVDRLSGWTQVYSADFLRTDQPRVSDLRNGRLTRFSLEQLVRFVARTKGEVKIHVVWTPYFLYRRASPRTPRPGATPSTRR
jgi:predicted XRE-type DNA-binding protein